MSSHFHLAKQFGDLIAKEDYATAHTLLTSGAQRTHTVRRMKQESESMRKYAPGPFRNAEVFKEAILEDWPAKRDGDVACVYISLVGDNFCEAVSIIITEKAGCLQIRDLEWGRP